MRFKVPRRQPENFRASALYLAGLVQGHTPDRVEFVEARNLQTTDPNAAAAVMEATAAKSARCKQAPYHFIITFDPKDAAAGKITPELKRKVAGMVIEDMGLKEHQILVYSHKDTDHPHMHFLVNRVHPKRHRAYDRHQDGKRLAGIVQERARELGLNVLRNRDYERQFGKDQDRERDAEDMMPSVSDGEYWKARREGREVRGRFDFDEVEHLRATLYDDFRTAKTWGDLSQRLAQRGITMERKGQGLVLSDGEREAKLSDMGKGARFKELESRFGQRYDDFLAERAQELAKDKDEQSRDGLNGDGLSLSPDDENTIRAMEEGELEQGHVDPVSAFDHADLDYRYWAGIEASYRMVDNKARTAARQEAFLDKAEARDKAFLARREASLMDILGKVYSDAGKARTAWDELEERIGVKDAEKAVMANPMILGSVRGIRLGELRTPGRNEAKRMARYLGERRRRWRESINRLGHTRSKIETARVKTKQAVHELERLERVTGSAKQIKGKVIQKIRARANALERVTERAFRESRVADERKVQLEKAWRKERERRRKLEKERDRGDAFGLDLSNFGDR